MDSLNARISELSPAKRALLEQRLKHTVKKTGEIISITRREEAEYYPLSFAQTRLWLLDQLVAEKSLSNRPANLRIVGQLNTAVLGKTLNTIIHRHQIVGAIFTLVDGQLIQTIVPAFTLDLLKIDISHFSREERQKQLQTLAVQEANKPFDLAQSRLIRASLVKLAEQEHILLLTFHHIVFDGWSMGVLLQEFSALYQAFLGGKNSPLPELQIQYTDFAVWQKEYWENQGFKSQLAYWKKQLGGELPILNLPTDRPKPPIQTLSAAKQALSLSQSLTDSLKSLSQREGTTLFMTLIAAFKILLYRYTSQEDIIVGIPIAGRDRLETESLIGIFINTLVLRTRLDPNWTFRDFLANVRQLALEAYEHQELPFEKLIEELQPERNLSVSPIFQVFFQLRNFTDRTLKTEGLEIEYFPVDRGVSLFELSLDIIENREGLLCEFEYNTDLFDRKTIERMAGHYQTLLEEIVTDGEQYLWELQILTQKERHQLLIEWNDTATDYPRDKCIHQLFEEQVARTPDALAVVFEDRQLTYQELNCHANQLARHLQTLGIGPDVLVGICVERSLEMVVGLLGILKAGGAYLPLDPAYPKERLDFMLSDAQIPLLLTQEELVERLPDCRAKVICLEAAREEIHAQSENNLANRAKSENLAYVMYTSGSTGKPKGVCVVHRGVVRLVKDTNYASFTAAEVFLQVAPISFDASTWEIWGALLNGARLVVFSPGSPSLAELGEALRLYKVTILGLTAGLFHLMVDERIEDLKGLRQLLAGGDVLSVPHVQKLLPEVPNCKLINGYGPTENTTFTCCFTIAPDSQISNSVPIGRAIANTQVYILDRHLQPVPIGVPGELYAGGAGLARGYLNRPDLTAERFIPNPFIKNEEDGLENAKNCSSHLYKTGDLARYLLDGNIEYLGRADNQVKIRGFRIEMGEIEAVLAGHPDVSQVAIAVQLDASGNKCLAAYAVPRPGKILAAATLRSFLQQRLPDYMIPAGFAFLDALPLNPNGKVDRRALATQKWQSASVAPDETIAVTPRDKLELQVTQIWEQVLGINSVGIRDNFFEVGGHSLLAARLLAEIEKVFDKKLPLSAIFQSPTVEQLASILREPEWSSPSPSMVVIQPGTGSYKPPLFCIHVLGRGLEFYRPLLNYLDRSQAVLGLSTQIMDEKLAPPNRVEELAAYYIKEMQTFQPHGPYFLLGVSFGGTVAFEMARQLHDGGETVALLGLLDTVGPAISPLSATRKSPLLMRLLRIKPAVFLEKAKGNLRGKFDLLMNILKRILCKFYRAIGRPLPVELQDFTYGELNNDALRHYVAGVYPRQATLFKAVESASLRANDREFGWGEVVTGGIEIHEIPSDHLGMLKEPHVRVLGEKLQAAVDRAREMNCQ